MTTLLSTQIPENINPLSPNGYMFALDRIPSLSYFCQEVALPSITLPEVIQNTPFSRVSLPGDQIDYGVLTIQFLIDEKMENYKAIHNWLIGLGFPENYQQYTDVINSSSMLESSEVARASSDAALMILGNDNNMVQTIKFVDCIPQSLESITFTSTSQDVQYLIGNATFSYSYYKFI